MATRRIWPFGDVDDASTKTPKAEPIEDEATKKKVEKPKTSRLNDGFLLIGGVSSTVEWMRKANKDAKNDDDVTLIVVVGRLARPIKTESAFKEPSTPTKAEKRVLLLADLNDKSKILRAVFFNADRNPPDLDVGAVVRVVGKPRPSDATILAVDYRVDEDVSVMDVRRLEFVSKRALKRAQNKNRNSLNV